MTHPLFVRFPISAEKVPTSAGAQPTPYHVYDGHALLIGGTADYAAVSSLLAPDPVVPVRTAAGRALMALWAVDEPQASHGPHTELQFSFYVSRAALPPVPDGPFALLRLLLLEPAARQLCHGLWNNTPQVVAYNRERLLLPAALAISAFGRRDGRVTFAFQAAESGLLLAEGDLKGTPRTTLGATLALFRLFGLRNALRAANLETVELYVVNPVSAQAPRSLDAFTASASDKLTARLFEPAADRVQIAAYPYSELDFRPTFMEEMSGFKMVYLEPQEA